MKVSKLILLLIFLFPMSGFARSATNQEEIEAEAQVQGTVGDLGEKALQKEESIEVDPQQREIPELEPDIIQDKNLDQDD